MLIVDAGRCQWACGYAYDDGPSVLLPAPAAPDGDREAIRAQVLAAFEELEVDADDGLSAIVTEPPGTSAAAREGVARAFFRSGIRSLHIVAAPLLAMYSTDFETGVIVDVGHCATHVFCMHSGLPALPIVAATMHPVAGAHAVPHDVDAEPDHHSPPTSCEHLFGPCGVHDAVARTVGLADVTLREALFGRVVCVGGGSLAPGFAERLSDELRAILGRASCPWDVRVFASNERRCARRRAADP